MVCLTTLCLLILNGPSFFASERWPRDASLLEVLDSTSSSYEELVLGSSGTPFRTYTSGRNVANSCSSFQELPFVVKNLPSFSLETDITVPFPSLDQIQLDRFRRVLAVNAVGVIRFSAMIFQRIARQRSYRLRGLEFVKGELDGNSTEDSSIPVICPALKYPFLVVSFLLVTCHAKLYNKGLPTVYEGFTNN